MGILQARILEWAAISYSGDLPDLGIEPASPVSPALASGFFTTEPPGNTLSKAFCCSVAKSDCNPMDCSRAGFSNLHYVPEFA